jgi:adenosylhomocysteine nucleosidase
MTIGIIGAMPEEIADLLDHAKNFKSEEYGKRTYYSGELEGHEVVLVLSRIGKVAAGSTATTLIDKFKAKKIIFTGVAGGVAPALKVGDIVIANSLLQHDMDASAIMNFKKYEIPLLGRINFESDPDLVKKAVISAEEFISTHPKYKSASVLLGLIASGDKFIFTAEKTQKLIRDLPDLLAVEMEGAAVAQVCFEWDIPFVVIRSISDNANHDSTIDFPKFISEFAAPFSAGIIKNLLKRL